MMKRILIHLIFCMGVLTACNKPDPSPSETPGDPQPVPTPPAVSPSIYIAGDSVNSRSYGLPYPVYWINGKQVHLPDPSYASATGIVVSGNDVYVSGSGSFSQDSIAYWKNGIGINLYEPSVNAMAVNNIVLSGNDLYIVGSAYTNGYEKRVPMYWKNSDKVVKMPTFSSSSGEAKDIAVSGNDIYIAGSTYDYISAYSTPACVWKNGIPGFLKVATATSGKGMAKAIAVSGPDVHVAGEAYHAGGGLQRGWAVYWKNGVATELTASTVYSFANAITLVNNDVYIAGAITASDAQPRATYWKNGILVTLDHRYSVANDIAVYENDVYVVGQRGRDTAVYWKNGVPVILGGGSANAIFIKK